MAAGKKNKKRPITVQLKTPITTSSSSSSSTTTTTARLTSSSSSSSSSSSVSASVDLQINTVLPTIGDYQEASYLREEEHGEGNKEVPSSCSSSQNAPLHREEASSSSSSFVKVCRHLERGVHLEEISSNISKTRFNFSDCKDCIGDGKGIGGGKKNKKKKKKGKPNRKTISESLGNNESKWICLTCGRIFCGNLSSSPHQTDDSTDDEDDDEEINSNSHEKQNGPLEKGHILNGKKKGSWMQENVENEKRKGPSGHIWKHCLFAKHPVALLLNENLVCWCFMCNMSVHYSIPEPELSSGNGGYCSSSHNSLLLEAVKIIHGKLRKETGLSKDPGKKGISLASSSILNVVHNTRGNSLESFRPSPSSIVQSVGTQRKRLIRGLMNLGNTCFFNSVMQNILALDMLRDYFTQQMLDFDGPLVSSLRKLYLETSSEISMEMSGTESGPKRNGKDSWENIGVCNPKSLFGAICSKAPRFKGFQQQDSHELLKCLLEGLNLEEQSAKGKQNSNGFKGGASIGTQNNVVTDDSECNDGKSENKNFAKSSSRITETTTFVENFFGGQLCSTVCCQECGHSSVVYEPMIDLSLQILTRQASKKSVTSPTSPGTKNKKGVVQKDTKKLKGAQKKEPKPQIPFVGSAKTAVVSIRQPTFLGEDSLSSDKGIVDNSSVEDFGWLDFIGCGIQSAESSIQGCQNALGFDEVRREYSVLETQELYSSGNNQTTLDDVSFNEHVHTDLCASGAPNGKCVIENGLEKEEEQLPLASGILLLPYEPLSVSEDILKMPVHHLEPECDDFDGFSQLFEEEESVPMIKHNVENSAYEVIEENVEDVLWETDFVTFDEGDSIVKSKCSIKIEDSFLPMSLEGCLADFTKTELLCGENAWECENCTQRMKELSQMGFSSKVATEDVNVGNISEPTVLKVLNANSNGTNCTATYCSNDRSLCLKPLEFENGNMSSSEISCNGEDNLNFLDKKSQKHGNLAYKNAKLLERHQSMMPNNNDNDTKCARDSCDSGSSDFKLTLKERKTRLNSSSSRNKDDLNSDDDIESIRNSLSSNAEGRVNSRNQQQPEKLLKRDATKRLLISKAPPILTVHLKRFAQDMRGRLNKLNGHVSFPESLDLRPFLDARCFDSNNFMYRLVGIVEHGGTMRGGHYIAYVRGPCQENSADKDSWYYISDSSVRKATLEAVLNSEAYLLFYEKCKINGDLKTQ